MNPPMYPMPSHKHERHGQKSMFRKATRVGGLLRSVGQIGAFGAVLVINNSAQERINGLVLQTSQVAHFSAIMLGAANMISLRRYRKHQETMVFPMK